MCLVLSTDRNGWRVSNLDFGLADIPLASGDHLCVLYSGADERNAILGAYVSAGLAAGHRCLCVVEADDQPGLLAAVTDGGDAQGYVDSEQLEFVTAANSYLAGTSFSITDSLAMWTDRADLALDEGFSELRGAGDAELDSSGTRRPSRNSPPTTRNSITSP